MGKIIRLKEGQLRKVIEGTINNYDENNQIKRLNQNDCSDDSIQIISSRKILNWMVEKQTEDFQNNHKLLTSDLRKELTNIFGPQNKTITGEFRHKLWKLGYKDLKFNIFSAANKGTTIEICNLSFEDIRNDKRYDDIIEFLERISKLINFQHS